MCLLAISGPFTDRTILNDKFPYLFIYFNWWNPFPFLSFLHLKPENGTVAFPFSPLSGPPHPPHRAVPFVVCMSLVLSWYRYSKYPHVNLFQATRESGPQNWERTNAKKKTNKQTKGRKLGRERARPPFSRAFYFRAFRSFSLGQASRV